MKTIIITLLALSIGIVALNMLGRFFISEITQEPAFVEQATVANDIGLGKPAPHFELLDLAGTEMKSSDFLGSPTVLTFWTTWNLASADQIKIFHEYITERKEKLFKIITISSQEDKSAVSSFINRGAYTVDVLLDEAGEATEAYKARNLPTTYFIDKHGIVRDIFVGTLSKAMLIKKAEKILGD